MAKKTNNVFKILLIAKKALRQYDSQIIKTKNKRPEVNMMRLTKMLK